MKKFVNGQDWESDFDVIGMYNFALKVKHTDKLEKLEKLGYTMTALNYHSLSVPLYQAINKLKIGDKDIKEHITQFIANVQHELDIEEKIKKFELVVFNTKHFLQYDGVIFCQLDTDKRQLIQYPTKNELYDIELMKFFVTHDIGEVLTFEATDKRLLVTY